MASRHHEGVHGVRMNPFLTLALGRGDWSNIMPRPFVTPTPEKDHGTH